VIELRGGFREELSLVSSPMHRQYGDVQNAGTCLLCGQRHYDGLIYFTLSVVSDDSPPLLLNLRMHGLRSPGLNEKPARAPCVGSFTAVEEKVLPAIKLTHRNISDSFNLKFEFRNILLTHDSTVCSSTCVQVDLDTF
jgi:hypothetical protein